MEPEREGPVEGSLKNLQELIDRYEHPELFTFLDDNQLQLELYRASTQSPFRRNGLVSLKNSDSPENGIVTAVSAGTVQANFYGAIRSFEKPSSELLQCETKILPLEWAKKGIIGDTARFKLKALASHLHFSYSYDKMQALSNSRTRLLPHQVESTYRVVTSLSPRFLIADEVGLGKTIEAGLIIKEFLIRHQYRSILIVVPASLQLQWQQEMKEKFNEEFWVCDSRAVKKLKSRLPNRVIMSLDFAKQENIKTLLLKKHWDTVVFDEAHRLRRDARSKTQAYTLAEEICGRCQVLLLLSATPFSGKLEELFYLVRLLDPDLLGTINDFTTRHILGTTDDLKDRIAPILIRRRKVEVGGFTKRLAKTITLEFTPEERALYDRTTEYIKDGYNRALAQKNKLLSFIMIVYQKLLDSSSHALKGTIDRRIAWLEGILSSPEKIRQSVTKTAVRALSELEEDLDGAESGELEKILAEHSEKAEKDMRIELRQLKEIRDLAESVKTNKKTSSLLQLIRELKEKNPGEKVLIFTQFFRTQEYLSAVLRNAGYRIALFHGGLDARTKDRAVTEFQESADVLISTEAGGEGRNLQFCRVLVNYDLPWNPFRVEQRIGRIHRFGQKFDVRIFNFAIKDTIAERVLDVMQNKIHAFEESIGEADTLLGYYEDEIDFNKTFMDFHVRPAAVRGELEAHLAKAREHFSYLEHLTVPRVLDLNLDAYYEATHSEREFTGRHMRMMVEKISDLPESEIVISGRQSLLLEIGEKSGLKKWKGHFDSKHGLEHPEHDLFAYGHPLVDQVSDRVRENAFLGLTASIKRGLRTAKRASGCLFNFLVTFRSSKLWQYMIPVFMDKDIGIDRATEALLSAEFLKFDFTDSRGSGLLEPEKLTRLFNKALLFLEFKIKDTMDKLTSGIEKQIGVRMPVINSHFNQIFAALESMLAIQKSKEKLYGNTGARSLISKTEHRIKKYKERQQMEMERMRRLRSIHVSYELINMAFVDSSL